MNTNTNASRKQDETNAENTVTEALEFFLLDPVAPTSSDLALYAQAYRDMSQHSRLISIALAALVHTRDLAVWQTKIDVATGLNHRDLLAGARFVAQSAALALRLLPTDGGDAERDRRTVIDAVEAEFGCDEDVSAWISMIEAGEATHRQTLPPLPKPHAIEG